jgi:hypothetical protein
MSDSSRRETLRTIALTAALGPLSTEAAQHVHRQVAAEGKQTAGAYKPKLLTPHEFETLAVLSDIIIPGARQGGAAEFIDLLSSNNEEFANMYTGGLAWLDREMEDRHAVTFLKGTPEQRAALLDLIAYRKNEGSRPDLAFAIRFFDLARRMSADAYFTSPAGVSELGYKGNKGMAEYQVPKQALEYALKRSGLP